MASPPDPDPALVLAQAIHAGQRDRYGHPMIDHVTAVAGAVPGHLRHVALVHDICERSRLTPHDVARRTGLDADERRALELLTKSDGETLLEHTKRILDARPGRARDIATTIKLADLADHQRRSGTTDGPHAIAANLLSP